MVASGAPERTELHAQNIADLALTMLDAVKKIKTPDGKGVDIRIGKTIIRKGIILNTVFKKKHRISSGVNRTGCIT